MMLLQIQQLTKYFGAELILSNIKLEIQSKDRIALVGRNGAGKSTLLKMIAGHLSYDSGQIVKPKDVSIGYLAQNTGLESSLSIWDEMLSVFDYIKKMEQNLRNIELELANSSHDGHAEKLLKEYDQLQIKFEEIGGYQYESDIRSVLHGLRFYEQDYSTLIATLSGGQKTRLALAKLLLTKPDILILDEPTNHLDIETLTWLEQYLVGYPGAILIVSHDRYFLDKIVTQVYELSMHELKKFYGNYSKYLVQKAENYEREMKLYEKQQDEVSKLQDFIQRNLARASTTKRAQSRRKQLEKMQLMDRPAGGDKSASISFGIEKQSGNDVLKIRDAAIGYGNTPLSRNIRFSIFRRDSIALVGPNGVGKSTLLKTIIKKLKLLSGNIDYGTNVTIGYYDQEQAELSSNKTVLQELWDHYPLKDEKEIRTMLGNFLFSGDDVQKTVSTLSGGEKARLALAILMLEQANFLILDEPTNHLDLDSKEVLENALVDYPGTILFVSHDRYFINRIASKVVELSPNGTIEYLGDYGYYVEKKAEMLEIARLNAEKSQSKVQIENRASKTTFQQDKEAKKLERQRKRRVEEIEERLGILEEKMSELEELLCKPEIFEDHEKVMSINKQIEEIKLEMDQLLEEWEEVSELLQE
ncbi:ABC-F type ribosomal protection protein [Bacillus sp. FJAT-49711]|uniref:ABC-F family ATP-binding cassette domain-containing protein n=1 Tax=Bacillus sp. FJAT-49711 TaxID=2833585 RepID=UPI001BC99832|nr:ABC-F type ribosomal protection protein [Bacillus sp. FJAT-49711]MBS4220772.1 ABC-F type ribosomal protection protein [Bacillus sp. FJAT-49711]